MLMCCDSSLLPKCFGDFGGNYDITDSAKSAICPDVKKNEEIIKSPDFEEKFREILPMTDAGHDIRRFETSDGKIVYSVPDRSKNYILAAELAFAVCSGYSKASFGTNDKVFALLFADVCSRLDLKARIILGMNLLADGGLISELKAKGADVDASTCEKFFDLPYAYIEVPGSDPSYYPVHLDANFGAWPRPAMAGLFAGFYGRDVLEMLGSVPEVCCVPIKSGIEAIALFRALKGSKTVLATCEEAIAAEYHMIDNNAYTISTRSASKNEAETTICPEIADMWRKCKALRLGCDRITETDLSAFNGADLSEITKRAAAIAFEETGCAELLIVEAE